MRDKIWRLLPLIETNASIQMAIDEAILTTRAKEKVPNTLRFYTWKPQAVSIGYFQSAEKEVNLENLKSYNVDLVRRITGGGAVFHDKEITYSIVISEKDAPYDIQESYEKICNALIIALNNLGLNSEFRKINDILVNGKKISGSAQTRKEGIILQHGTLLLDLDVEKMFSLLRVPDEKIRDKMISSVKERVTSVKKELGREVSIDEIRNLLINGFSENFSVSFSEENLTSEEKKLSERLQRKYLSEEWTFKR
ncbi:MAG: biotin/lipoate A/B protein ligase family protein [Candidatus Altiarchaeota archaeon]